LLPGTSGKKIFQFQYFLSHSDKRKQNIVMNKGSPKKKSEQTGCQHIQFTELEQKELEDKNSTEKPQRARDQKIRLQITQFL
jgi:hypothetical protein